MKNLYILLIIAVCFTEIYSQAWVEQMPPGPQRQLRSVSAYSPQFIWACGDTARILYTSNGGANWIIRNYGIIANGNACSIIGIDSAIAVCLVNVSNGGYIYRTSNRGVNWTQTYYKPNGFFNDIKMLSGGVAIIYGNPVGNKWTIFKTIDGGLSFDTNVTVLNQVGNETGFPNAMCVTGSIVMFGTNNRKIYKSTNNGSVWTPMSIASNNIYTISFNNINTGFAAGDTCFYSTNNGGQWAPIYTLPGTGVFNTMANSGTEFWYGRGNQIFHSTNNGVSFILQYTRPTGGIYKHLSFVSSATNNILTTIRGWGVTNNGAISYYNSSASGVVQLNNDMPDGFYLSQNYPNPFNPLTKIHFAIPHSSNIKLTVLDLLGREVVVLINENLKAGNYESIWDGSLYPSGIYFCKLESGYNSEIRKMVLLK